MFQNKLRYDRSLEIHCHKEKTKLIFKTKKIKILISQNINVIEE